MASVAAVTGLTLINADNDQVIAANLNNGTVLNLATLPTKNLSIRAEMGDGTHESVSFVLDGQTIRTESIAPYAIAGNNNDDYFGWTPSLGSHTLTVTPYEKDDARGNAGQSRSISFNVINEPAPEASQAAVMKLSLINADTDKVIVDDLANVATIDFTKIGTKNLSIRATMSDGSVESVKFELDGAVKQIENISHFAINGNAGNDYKAWTPSLGVHTLTVTGYSKDNAQGDVNASKTISFTVVQSAQSQPTPTPAPAPTPAPVPAPAPSPVIDDNDVSGTDNTGDFNAPVPVIQHTTDKTINAGQAVHVSGTLTTVSVGSIENATFEWDFGDAGSKYNVIRGFNAAHVYTKPGTYTVKLTVTNSAGKSATKTTTVTVTNASRKIVYVSNSGSDSNDGSAPDRAIRSFDKAASMVGDNTEILFRRGDTFTTDEGMTITASNVVIGAYGDSGNAPVIKYDGPRSYTSLFSGSGSAENVAIRNLTLDSVFSSTSITDEDKLPIGVKPNGKNFSISDCKFLNLGYAINTNSEPVGVLAQDNVAPTTHGLRGYFAWVQGSDHAYYGNYVANTNAHVVRVGGADRVALAYNDFTNPAEDGKATRGTLTIHKGSYVYVYANELNDGKVTIGPLGEGDGLDTKDARWKYGTFESNVIKSYMIIEHGAENIAVRNNVIESDGTFGLQIEGYSSTYGRGVKNVTVDRNTGFNDSTKGSFVYVTGDVNGIVMTRNLYIAPNLETGSYKSAGLRVSDSNLNSFTLISGNVWPDAKTIGSADGTNLVGTSESSSDYQSASEWEAWSVVKGDFFKDVTLSSHSFQVSLSGVTAGSSLKLAA